MILISESIGDFTHHHHIVRCGFCGAWWFDDVIIGGLGTPVPLRRDTQFCQCDESLPQYSPSLITVPGPESQCSCTKADVDRNSLPLRPPVEKRPATQAVIVPREAAVREIAGHIADRDAFIIGVPPGALAFATKVLRKLDGSACYLDIGVPVVTVLRSPNLGEAADMAATQMPGTAIAVYTIPKTIPARHLSRLVGRDIPADGSQDLIMLQDCEAANWPTLLLDAIGRVDPQFAATMYANDSRNMS